MRHFSALANSDDKKDGMISDLQHRDHGEPATESQPTASASKEGKPWHLTVSSHLHVVRVLHEDLIPETSETVKERYKKPHPSDKNVVLGVSEDQLFKICFSVSGFVCGFRRWSVESVLSRLLLAVIGHRTSWVKVLTKKCWAEQSSYRQQMCVLKTLRSVQCAV